MTRVFLSIVLPFFLPTALYVFWALVTDRIRLSGPAAAWGELPWTWLVLAGAAMSAAILVMVVQISDDGDGTYVPPHLENGRVVPGHVIPAAPSR